LRPESDDCFVCRKHRGEIAIPGGTVYEDDLVYASHGKPPDGATTQYPGLLFVEPRRHVPGMSGLTRAEAERVGWLVSRLSRALETSEKAERTYLAVLGHHVPHLHVWLVPRYPGTPSDVWGTAVLEWAGRPRASAAEVESLCQRIREQLEEEE
jgi:diadenosine tetraphosphate (Ap4A) HIT family hydrolase